MISWKQSKILGETEETDKGGDLRYRLKLGKSHVGPRAGDSVKVEQDLQEGIKEESINLQWSLTRDIQYGSRKKWINVYVGGEPGKEDELMELEQEKRSQKHQSEGKQNKTYREEGLLQDFQSTQPYTVRATILPAVNR